MISCCFRKVQQDEAEGLLITPAFKSRPLYPVILSLPADFPILLLKSIQLLQLPGTQRVHHICIRKYFQIAAWPISRKKMANKDVSKKVSNILLAFWRKKTSCQYEYAWRNWSSWWYQRQDDPFSTTLTNILEFLSDLFHQGF